VYPEGAGRLSFTPTREYLQHVPPPTNNFSCSSRPGVWSIFEIRRDIPLFVRLESHSGENTSPIDADVYGTHVMFPGITGQMLTTRRDPEPQVWPLSKKVYVMQTE